MLGIVRKGCAALVVGAASAAIVMTQGADIAVVTVARGPLSAIEETREVVVRDRAAWEQLWKSHAAAAAVPPVDFERDMVAAVFLGMKNTGGFSVEILRGRREGATLIVEYAERSPGADAVVIQMLTSPFHIVRMAKHTGPVQFRRVAPNATPK